MTLNVKQTALRLNVSPSLVYALCAAGKLPHYRVGVGRGCIRIEEVDLETVRKSPPPRPQDRFNLGLKHLALN